MREVVGLIWVMIVLDFKDDVGIGCIDWEYLFDVKVFEEIVLVEWDVVVSFY